MGIIYKITCIPTGLSYIGQTSETKTKNGKPYAYGVVGRWNDHVSCVSSTPLGVAIQTFGRDSFSIETVENYVDDERLDEREAHWINELKTITPHGYNKMRHGRCRHRESSSVSDFYAPLTASIRLRQICKSGEPRLIYAYLQQKNGEEVRIIFGQGKNSAYSTAVEEANTFLESFPSVPVEADPRILNPDASPYETKIAQFDDTPVTKIRVAKFNTLVAVYVNTARVCFGGKRSTFEQSIEKALAFAHALLQKHPDAILSNTASKSATGDCLSS